MLNVHSSHHNERIHMEGHVEFGEQAAMGMFDTHVCISIIAPCGVAFSGQFSNVLQCDFASYVIFHHSQNF